MDKTKAEIVTLIATPKFSNPVYLTASMILERRKINLQHKLPHTAIDEIKSKSKTDSFVRIIAVVQIIWTTA